MATFKAIIVILPQIFGLIQWAKNLIEDGVSIAQIKKDGEMINNAFKPGKPAHQTAGELNDIFKN